MLQTVRCIAGVDKAWTGQSASVQTDCHQHAGVLCKRSGARAGLWRGWRGGGQLGAAAGLAVEPWQRLAGVLIRVLDLQGHSQSQNQGQSVGLGFRV